MKEFFPITLEGWNNNGGGDRAFKKIFLEHKPLGKLWYAYTTVIKSKTRIQFKVYGMQDNVYGGVGMEIYRFSVTVPFTVTQKAIAEHAEYLARMRREKELEKQEKLLIIKYKHEILSQL